MPVFATMSLMDTLRKGISSHSETKASEIKSMVLRAFTIPSLTETMGVRGSRGRRQNLQNPL